MTLQSTAVRSVKWNSLSQAFKLSLYFLTTVILSRLLDPSDFGLLGMATVFTSLIFVFNDFGLGSAIIQNRQLTNSNLSTIFWLSLIIGTFTMGIAILISPWVAIFYNQPHLQPLLNFMSLSFLLSSLGQVQLAQIIKRIDFKRVMIIESVAGACGASVAIALALLNYGVWSLASQNVITIGIVTSILWITSDWKPDLTFNTNILKKVLGFSSSLLSFNLLNYFSRNADYLLVGKFLGSALLGQYTFAYRLMQFPLHNISNVVSRVLFPTLSQVQESDSLFREIFIKASQFIAFITFPLMICLFLLSREMVIVIFGAKWQPAIPVIQILALVGMVQSVASLVGNIYTAKGKTNWLFAWGVFSSIITVTSFIIGLRWGIVGVAAGYACATIILVYPSFIIPFRFIGLNFIEYIFSLRRQISTTAIAGIVAFSAINLQKLLGLPEYAILIGNAAFFFVIYLALVIILDRQTLVGVIDALFGRFSQIALRYVPSISIHRMKKG